MDNLKLENLLDIMHSPGMRGTWVRPPKNKRPMDKDKLAKLLDFITHVVPMDKGQYLIEP